jgi:hypothetical protein
MIRSKLNANNNLLYLQVALSKAKGELWQACVPCAKASIVDANERKTYDGDFGVKLSIEIEREKERERERETFLPREAAPTDQNNKRANKLKGWTVGFVKIVVGLFFYSIRLQIHCGKVHRVELGCS